jgi:hypothetical protein
VVTYERRVILMRRAQLLAAVSVTYNTVEAVIAITAGNIAGSSAEDPSRSPSTCTDGCCDGHGT